MNLELNKKYPVKYDSTPRFWISINKRVMSSDSKFKYYIYTEFDNRELTEQGKWVAAISDKDFISKLNLFIEPHWTEKYAKYIDKKSNNIFTSYYVKSIQDLWVFDKTAYIVYEGKRVICKLDGTYDNWEMPDKPRVRKERYLKELAFELLWKPKTYKN